MLVYKLEHALILLLGILGELVILILATLDMEIVTEILEMAVKHLQLQQKTRDCAKTSAQLSTKSSPKIVTALAR